MSATLRWSAAALAIGGAGIWLWSQTRAPESEAPAAQPAAQSVHAAVAPSARPALATTPAHEPTPREEEAQAHSVFERERVDAAWATPRRSELATELDKAASGTDARVKTVDCRTTTCRVEVAVADSDAGATFVRSWLHTRTTGGGAYIAQSDGALVMYIARGEATD